MKISFSVKINKLGICYFYLSNLALEGKKFWVREKYNEKFISVVGPLTPQEKKGISLLKQSILSLEKKQINLLDIFWDRYPWKKLSSYNEYKNIRSAFKILDKKWKVFWNIELKKTVIPTKKSLEYNIQKRERLFREIFKNLSTLYGRANLPPFIKIFLVPLPEDIHERGGKYIPNISSIVLEVSNRKSKEKRTVEIILHEAVHLFFENEKYFHNIIKLENMISLNKKRKLVKPFKISSIGFGIREIAASAITMKPIKRKQLSNKYADLVNYCSIKLKSLIRDYLRNKRGIDFYFVKSVFSIWQDFMKKRP